MQGYVIVGDIVVPLELGKGPRLADGRLLGLDSGILRVGEKSWPVAAVRDGDRVWVHLKGRIHELLWRDPVAYHEAAAASGNDNLVAAPMPGIVVRLIAADGADVAASDALLVIESMKLETTLRAPADGTLSLHVAAGQGFDRGAPLAIITPKD